MPRGIDQFAAGEEKNAVLHPARFEHPARGVEGHREREANGVHKHPGGGAGAPLGPVDGDKVWKDLLAAHLVHKRGELLRIAHAQFHPRWQARYGAHALDERHGGGKIGTLHMSRRRNHVFSRGDLAQFGDFLAHFFRGQNSSLAGFGSLGEFDFDHADFGMGAEVAQGVLVQGGVLVAHAEFGRAHLEDQVGPALQMVFGMPALAGVREDARLPRAAAQRLHRFAAQRPVTHAADHHWKRQVHLARIPAAQGHLAQG